MYLEKVKIHNFRLLEDVEFTFHKESTLIVGKNNSGKTSLNEIFNRTNNLKNKLKIEDFNIKSFEKFIDFFGFVEILIFIEFELIDRCCRLYF